MLWLVASVCIEPKQCWHLLAFVTCSWKPVKPTMVKLLAHQVPTFPLFCDRRSVVQQWNPNNDGLVKTSAHAPCNIFFQKTNNRSAFSSFWIVVNMAYVSSWVERIIWGNSRRLGKKSKNASKCTKRWSDHVLDWTADWPSRGKLLPLGRVKYRLLFEEKTWEDL